MRLSSSVQILASDISKTHNQLLEDMDVPSGRLNVSATNAFGALWVAPRMSKFKNLFPEINVALSLRDSEPRVTNFNSDIEVRMTPSVSQDDIQIKLADCRYKIFEQQASVADRLRSHFLIASKLYLLCQVSFLIFYFFSLLNV